MNSNISQLFFKYESSRFLVIDQLSVNVHLGLKLAGVGYVSLKNV